MKPISGKTKLCAVIGDPIGHTISPQMHNAAFEYLDLDYRYVGFKVKPELLSEAVAGIRALGIRGLNVTVPHKVNIVPFLDELDSLAKKIGAINTVTNNDGILKGYNTDAAGFLRALEEMGIKLEDKYIVVVGAGGVARAISFALADSGAKIAIINRALELEWACELARSISDTFGFEVKVLELTNENLALVLDKADMVVNATSLGMSPQIESTPVPAILLRPELVVFDVVYNPCETRLIKEARMTGSQAVGGLDMLVWQGALAFEKWTGIKAPLIVMKKAACKALSIK